MISNYVTYYSNYCCYQGDNYFEIDVDVGSSSVARWVPVSMQYTLYYYRILYRYNYTSVTTDVYYFEQTALFTVTYCITVSYSFSYLICFYYCNWCCVRNVVGLAIGYSKAIVVDMGFCLQVCQSSCYSCSNHAIIVFIDVDIYWLCFLCCVYYCDTVG